MMQQEDFEDALSATIGTGWLQTSATICERNLAKRVSAVEFIRGRRGLELV